MGNGGHLPCFFTCEKVQQFWYKTFEVTHANKGAMGTIGEQVREVLRKIEREIEEESGKDIYLGTQDDRIYPYYATVYPKGKKFGVHEKLGMLNITDSTSVAEVAEQARRL